MLGVTRESTTQEISRAYRALARKWHPDLHRGEEAKVTATEKFQLIAAAYECLRDEESRKDYDYMLDNPEEYYHHYYRYYRRMYAPKVDVRYVIVVTISLISAYQYYAAHSKYKEAIDYFVTVPKYRMKAKQIALDEGIWPTDNPRSKQQQLRQRGGGNRKSAKEELKAEEEAVIRRLIEEKMDIKGAYSRPSYRDLLWVQIVFFPIWIGTLAGQCHNIVSVVNFCTFLLPQTSQLHLLVRSLGVQVRHQQGALWPRGEALPDTSVHGPVSGRVGPQGGLRD